MTVLNAALKSPNSKFKDLKPSQKTKKCVKGYLMESFYD